MTEETPNEPATEADELEEYRIDGPEAEDSLKPFASISSFEKPAFVRAEIKPPIDSEEYFDLLEQQAANDREQERLKKEIARTSGSSIPAPFPDVVSDNKYVARGVFYNAPKGPQDPDEVLQAREKDNYVLDTPKLLDLVRSTSKSFFDAERRQALLESSISTIESDIAAAEARIRNQKENLESAKRQLAFFVEEKTTIQREFFLNLSLSDVQEKLEPFYPAEERNAYIEFLREKFEAAKATDEKEAFDKEVAEKSGD